MTGLEIVFIIASTVAIVAALAWVAAYLFAGRCRRRYAEQSMRIRHFLLMIDTDLAQQERAAGAYSPDSPEPYGLLAQDLQTRFQRARSDYQAGLAELNALERAQPALPAASLPRLAATYHPYPRDWWRLLKQIDIISQRAQAMQSHVNRIESALEQLRNVPADQARRARGLIGAAERINKTGQSLRQSGVGGDKLESELANAGAFIAVLDGLPPDMLQTDDDASLASITQGAAQGAAQEVASATYLTLKRIERPIYDCLRRLQNWQSQHAEAKNMVGAMQLEIGAAEKILRETPPQLDVFDHTAELQKLKRAAQDIEDQQRVLDVDDLPRLSNAATQQALQAKELAAHLMSLHKTYQSVEQVASANGRVLSRVKTTMRSLAQSSTCPVAWTRSAAECDRLFETHTQIIGGDAQRNAGRLKADLDKGVEVGLQSQALEAQVNRIRDLHQQLVTLVESAELELPNEWFQDVANTHIAASRYAPENWPTSESVTTLRADAVALAKRGQDLAPLQARQPLPEDQVPHWIDLASAYIRDRRAMRVRLDRIGRVLSQIETQDAATRNLVLGATRALSELVIDAAQLPPESRIAARWEELVEAWRRGERLGETLDRKDAGRVADKAVSAESWSRQCAAVVTTLKSEMGAETERARSQLRVAVDGVTDIAPFDMEPAMRAAQERLAWPRGNPTPETGPASVVLLVPQVNQAWQLLAGFYEATTNVESHIAARLDARPERVEDERRQAKDLLGQLDTWQRQMPDLKPLVISLTDADQLRQDYEQAEASLADIQHTGRTVKSVVARLDSLIQQYQYIASRGALVQTDLERDLNRLRDAWSQFSLWSRQLQRYRAQHSQDAAVAEAIDDRLAEIDRLFEDIQRRYKGQPVPLDYAWQELDSGFQSVYRELEVQRVGGREIIATRMIETAD